jgi:uncharacterized delta-60 repeat protein
MSDNRRQGLLQIAWTTLTKRNRILSKLRPNRCVSFELLEPRTVMTAGILDPTFGMGGLMLENGPPGLSEFDFGLQTLVQDDGKVLLLQQHSNSSDLLAYSLTRFFDDGSRDASFGDEGQVWIDGLEFFQPRAMVLQPDSKIVLAGGVRTQDGGQFAAARLHSDGSLDSSFGDSSGIAVVDFNAPGLPHASTSASSVATQSDGKIILGGNLLHARLDIQDGIGVIDFAVARLNEDGSIDTSFSADGRQVIDFDFIEGYAGSIAVQGDGKIVVGGSGYSLESYIGNVTDTGSPFFTWDFAVVRLTSDGNLDQAFGDGGTVAVDFGLNNDFFPNMALQIDGKFLIAGTTNGDIGAARLNHDGTLDPDFGTAGKVVTDLGAEVGTASPSRSLGLALQPNGKFVLGGSEVTFDPIAFTNTFRTLLIRYDADGSLDPSFGQAGVVLGPISSAVSGIASVAIDQSRRIVVAGTQSQQSTGYDAFVVRYVGNTAPVAFDAELSLPEGVAVIDPNLVADVDGDFLSLIVVDPPLHGTLAFDGSNVTYQPAPNYNGPDSFTYKVNDGILDSNMAIVEIDVLPVNEFPTPFPQDVELDEGDSYSGSLTAEDGDPEVDQALTFQVASEPLHGTLTLQSNGSFTYKPLDDNYNGPDSFFFRVTDDGMAGAPGPRSASTLVRLTIRPKNDFPIASNQSFSIIEDPVFPLAGTLSGDDGDAGVIQALTYDLVAGPSFGTLTLDSTTGAFTYQPLPNFFGSDTFTFTVTDDETAGPTAGLTSAPAVVVITVGPVNDAPVAFNNSYSTFPDMPLTISAASGVFSNDFDPDGDVLVVIAYTPPANGTLVINADGSFIYTPGTADVPTDSFSYFIDDGNGGLATATVFLSILPYAGVSVSGGIMRIGGTAAADAVSANGNNIVVNGATHSLAGITEVRIWAGQGDDSIDLSGLSVPAVVSGGGGNDALTGGSANDLIFGDAGNDTLDGRNGNDFLIGGFGVDKLGGQKGHDILASGNFAGALDFVTLLAISQAWASSHPVIDPTLDGFISTVFDDGSSDLLTGSAGADLFIINTGDDVTDFPLGKPDKNKDGDVVIRDGIPTT